jgi:uncharacterized membrane protein YecN with MAPEG domain
MAKIFVSYSRRDSDVVLKLSNLLKENGHSIVIDVDSISAGQHLHKTLADGLRDADVFIVFISSTSIKSQFVLSEIGAATAYASESDRTLVIPVLIDDIEIPSIIQDLLYIPAYAKKINEVAEEIENAIANFYGRRAAREAIQVERSQRMEANAAEYIGEAITLLETLEKRNRNSGVAWYVGGFLALVLGIFFGVYSFNGIETSKSYDWPTLTFLTFKGIVIVGLLGACSKYAFSLGKSYVSESLKSADRIHAISFGKFFLRVYGDRATWPEVKEVFQHWNIDRTSSFTSLGTGDFDPKFLDALVEVAKTVASRGAEKS